ncbi:hypothetical protein Tco_0474290 [Tanacetum coccineum]
MAILNGSTPLGIGSGSGPRCQDTILGDVNAQTRFEIASKQSNDPPLSRGYTLGSGEDSQVSAAEGDFINTSIKEKPEDSDGFVEIIDFLKASSVHYALTVNPLIYNILYEQFWGNCQESSIRKYLYLDDAEGIDCLPTATIFEELARELSPLKIRRVWVHCNASKQGRSIADLDEDDELTVVDETQERQDDELIEKDKQSTKLDDSTAGEAVTTASVEGSVAPTTIEEITLAQTLIQIKVAKPKVVTTAATTTTTTRPKARGVVVQEPSEFRTPQESQPSITKDKGKAIMIEPKVPLKRKDQVALNESCKETRRRSQHSID